MNLIRSVIAIKAAFNYVTTGQSLYGEMLHEVVLQKTDRWLSKLAANLGSYLSQVKHSSFMEDIESPVKLDSANWYSNPQVEQKLAVQREKMFDEATQFAKGVNSAHAGFMMLLSDRELPEEYRAPYELEGYKKLAAKCEAYGLTCTLLDMRVNDLVSPYHCIAARFEVDHDVWELGTTVSDIGQRILKDGSVDIGKPSIF